MFVVKLDVASVVVKWHGTMLINRLIAYGLQHSYLRFIFHDLKAENSATNCSVSIVYGDAPVLKDARKLCEFKQRIIHCGQLKQELRKASFLANPQKSCLSLQARSVIDTYHEMSIKCLVIAQSCF